ncbi:MAG: SHOCT domain-containing protein [Methanosarcinales archaeon]|nr:SHOCT domain-containing protein [Methanosarcinales archaeon]
MFWTLDGPHMMDWWHDGWWWGGDWSWWFFPFMGFGSALRWLVFLAVAFLVYRDAEEHGKNGLLWAILVLIPWLGILFLIIYLLTREEGSLAGVPRLEAPPGLTAEEILDQRYARGELTREEYLRTREDILGREQTADEPQAAGCDGEGTSPGPEGDRGLK